MRRNWSQIGMAVIAIVTLLGCTLSSMNIKVAQTSELQNESTTIAAEDVDSVRVMINMQAGELDIDGAAEDLLEAEFTYNVEEWEPDVTYAVTDRQGRLIIRQPNTDHLSIGSSIRNKWKLRFAEDIPLDMRIESGAGQQELDLAGLNITDLDMRLGAGDTEINLSDNPTLQRFDLDIGAGKTHIDLNGPWAQDVDIDIQGGMGEIELLLPSDVGVSVNVNRGVGELETRDLYRQGDVWVNAAYEESDITLNIRIEAGVGTINLDVRD